MTITPREIRQESVTVVVKQRVERPRCAWFVKDDHQCTSAWGGTGRESGFVVINGENLPFCGQHYPRAVELGDQRS